MKVHLAAQYERREEMVRVALRLSRAGHVVTSRWIEGEGSEVNDGDKAMHALADVSAAECLVLFTERPAKYVPFAARGERHVELGYALGLRKRIIVVGPAENVFHRLGRIERLGTVKELVDALR